MNLRNYRFAADGSDPARIPFRLLPGGAKIPASGLGRFGSDRGTEDQIVAAVVGTATVGYRHFGLRVGLRHREEPRWLSTEESHGWRRAARPALDQLESVERQVESQSGKVAVVFE